MPTTIEPEHELDAAHSDEPAAEGSSKEADGTGGSELQSEIEQETPIPSAQETEVDVVSSKDGSTADVVHEVKTEVETETQGAEAAATTNDFAEEILPEKEHPVVPTNKVFIILLGKALADPVLPLKDDSINHVKEAAIVAVGLAGLAAVDVSSSPDKVVPEVSHEAKPEAGNDSVETGTTLNVEQQQEREVDVTAAPETEDTHTHIDSNLPNDSTPVPLPVESESSLVETDLVAERQVETNSSATSIPINEEHQPDPSLTETAPDAEKETEEVQTQVDDTSNIKDETIPKSDVAQYVETADTEGPLEDASTKESQITFQLEPEVDSVLPVEEEPSTITQIAAEDILPKTESEGAAISQAPVETIQIPEDTTAPVADVEEQIISPVDVRSEPAAVVAHEEETEVEAESHETDAATATNDLAAAKSTETEQPVVSTTEVFINFLPVETC